MQKQSTTLQKTTDLLQRMDMVQTFASRGYWLSTTELEQLLNLDVGSLQGVVSNELGWEFAWRNFSCVLVGKQKQECFWKITYPVSPTIPDRLDPAHSSKGTSADKKPNQQIIPAVFARIDNFLSRELLQKLLKYVLENQSKFQSSTNSENNSDYRKSWVLYNFPEFSETICRSILSLVPQVIRSLKMNTFEIAHIESQLTAHNHGNYYKVHNDNGSPDSYTRELTYVYYFYQEPKQFSGGELLIYDGEIKNNMFDKADTYKTYTPTNNTIIFFPSHYLHEVLPVSCPSQKFADSRFTVNGWIRRKG